jgi:hypothetical protein
MSDYINHPVLGQIEKCCDNPNLQSYVDHKIENNKNFFFITCENCDAGIMGHLSKEMELSSFVTRIKNSWNRATIETQQKELLKKQRVIEQQRIEDQISFIQKIGASNDKSN